MSATRRRWHSLRLQSRKIAVGLVVLGLLALAALFAWRLA